MLGPAHTLRQHLWNLHFDKFPGESVAGGPAHTLFQGEEIPTALL